MRRLAVIWKGIVLIVKVSNHLRVLFYYLEINNPHQMTGVHINNQAIRVLVLLWLLQRCAGLFIKVIGMELIPHHINDAESACQKYTKDPCKIPHCSAPSLFSKVNDFLVQCAQRSCDPKACRNTRWYSQE